MTSRVGTDLDDEVFTRLNAEIAKLSPEPRNAICEYCEQPAFHCGLCRKHYNLKARRGDPLWQRKMRPAHCQAPEGCQSPVNGLGLCSMHATRFRRGGSPELQRIVEQYRLNKLRNS